MSVIVNIMIVDDNVNMAKTMSYILKVKGYSVTVAYDGFEAIERAREKNHFDVIFMDIQMPLMDGVETFKQIKKIIPGVAVVMMTGYAVEDLIEKAINEGARGILYKPVDMDKAIALI